MVIFWGRLSPGLQTAIVTVSSHGKEGVEERGRERKRERKREHALGSLNLRRPQLYHIRVPSL